MAQVNNQKETKNPPFNWNAFWRFFFPSLLGVSLFMLPIPYIDGRFVTYAEGFTIPIAVLKDMLQGMLGGELIALFITLLILVSSVATLLAKVIKPAFIMDNPYLKVLFHVSIFWTVIRVVGGVFVIIIYQQFGVEMIYSENTGGLLFNDLMTTLFVVFFLAGLLLPLMLEYGLLELIGVMLTRVMRPVFGLPGRSSVDCLASWLGDGTIGVLLTNKQMESGYYTKKEAATIATSFSAVSITFCLVVISEVNLVNYFLHMLGAVALCGFCCAIILPKLLPLARIDSAYLVDNDDKDIETVPVGHSVFSYGLQRAIQQGARGPSVKALISDGLKNVFDMWLGVLPVVMTVGTLGLIIAEETPIFTYLGLPFIPLLELLQIPFASEMSETIMVGFADMFLPAIIGGSIEADLTRFVIACLSVSQIVYLSEIGGLILGTRIPINFAQLLIIFILRTLISLPIIALFAHLIF